MWGARAAACAVVFDSTMVRFVVGRNRRKPPVHGWYAPSSLDFERVRRHFSSSLHGGECTAEDVTSTHFADGATLFRNCATCLVGHATLHPQRRSHSEWFTWKRYDSTTQGISCCKHPLQLVTTPQFINSHRQTHMGCGTSLPRAMEDEIRDATNGTTDCHYLNGSMMRMEEMSLRILFRTPPVDTKTGPARLNPIRGVDGQRRWR